MKKISFGIGLMFLIALVGFAPFKSSGVLYFYGVPDTNAETTLGSEIAYNKLDKSLWVWDTVGTSWQYMNKIQYSAGVPSGAPTYGNIGYYNTSTGLLYRYDGTWKELGDVSVSGSSSPTLTESNGVFTLSYSALTTSDALNISNAISQNSTAFNVLLDSTTTNISTYSLSDSQIDSLAQRIVETATALERISSNSQQEKNELIVNSSGADIFVKYTGVAPTYTGNLGIFTLSFDIDSTKVKSWKFGGGTAENVWDGSGDLQLNVTLTNSSPTTAEINAIFGNIQIINAGNGEVLSDPKGQLQVTVFQERTATATVQIRASNLTGFDTDGFKMVTTY